MSEVFRFSPGRTPLIVSVPHDGRAVPADIRARMTAAGRELRDTDWHVAELYDFARDMGASVIVANYSRYVVDLNRPREDSALYDGQLATGLCPRETFAGEPIYEEGGKPDRAEIASRVARYWTPYHERLGATLAELKSEHGYALLWDAHSIASRVPRLFDGELPVLNIGSNDGASCAPEMTDAVAAVAADSGYDWVANGRFKGGFITRHYGRPAESIHALQLEIAQRSYMDEATTDYVESRASDLQKTLAAMLRAFADATAALAGP